jgi:two-component sensor histidine kinase
MTGMEPVSLLLVDDLEENLLSLAALLRSDDLAILKARSGDQALELLLRHEVALALIDVQMPGLNGFELAELMRGNERTRRIPIIFVTAGTADRQRRFRGYEAGAVDFIYKPIEPDILRGKAGVFVELFRQRRQIATQRDELKAQTDALEEALQQQETLTREMSHRIKNLFSVADSMVRMTARSAATKEDLAEALSGRLHALSEANGLIRRSFGENVSAVAHFSDLIAKILRPHERARSTLKGPPLAVGEQAVNHLALVFHELATNAAKYGSLRREDGSVTVDWSIDPEDVEIVWREHGALSVQEPSAVGFGTKLVETTIRRIGGDIERDWRPDGLCVRIRLPSAVMSS